MEGAPQICGEGQQESFEGACSKPPQGLTSPARLACIHNRAYFVVDTRCLVVATWCLIFGFGGWRLLFGGGTCTTVHVLL